MATIDLADRLKTDSMNGLGPKLKMLAALSWPAMLAQMSTIVMEYIDASMVGSLGEVSSAAIGLVATSTWLLWGIGGASVTGFAVQVAHRVGAGDDYGARMVLRRSVAMVFLISVLVGLIGVAISGALPHWLGGSGEVCVQASDYFMIFSATLPALFMTFLGTSLLRCSGNMLVPGVANVLLCLLDVVFNFFLIFETREISLGGISMIVPGAGLGVAGAALGSFFAVLCAGTWIWLFLLYRSKRLKHPYSRETRSRHIPGENVLRSAVKIGWPVALERVVMCGAQICITAIVAPLGNAALAANAFAVTAEGLCYMPGYGLSDASTTLVGQSLGAGRKDLTISFGRIALWSGIVVMGVLGIVMWFMAPEMMGLFSPVTEIRELGTMALRTEAWAEPMFGAAIVGYGIFIGAGYTLVPATINFSSIWCVRLTLSAIMAPSLGLFGVWLAMCLELCVRGLAFLYVFARKKWLTKALNDRNQKGNDKDEKSGEDNDDLGNAQNQVLETQEESINNYF